VTVFNDGDEAAQERERAVASQSVPVVRRAERDDTLVAGEHFIDREAHIRRDGEDRFCQRAARRAAEHILPAKRAVVDEDPALREQLHERAEIVFVIAPRILCVVAQRRQLGEQRRHADPLHDARARRVKYVPTGGTARSYGNSP
jgi:hypothetical protein